MLSSHDFIYLKLNCAIIERFIHNDIVQYLHSLPISGNKIKNTPFWEFQKKKNYTSLGNLKLNCAIIERFIHNDIVQYLHSLLISGNKIKNTPFQKFQKKNYTNLGNLPYVYYN